MPTRREFLKLSAAAAVGAALWGCNGPDRVPTARPTETEPTKAIPPTKKAEVTDTPNVPATKEAERLNAVLAEGYPTSFAELSQEKMLSETDFLKQLEKFPNIGKEYKQVKAMLSAGLSKEKINLSDIAFEVSSFAWDSDKYSWIVIARNSKTGEVYIPRDGKTHTRNIDMSVYGYLKEYQAGGALPFTMEPLKLPEFSGPEYKVGFSRSAKGWLVATLDSGSKDGWYDFRDMNVARWRTPEGRSVVMKPGIVVEEGNYIPEQVKEIKMFQESLQLAIKEKRVFWPVAADRNKNLDGICEVLSSEDYVVGFRSCFRKDGKEERIVAAWSSGDGRLLVPNGSQGFVLSYGVETGSRLLFDDVSDLSPDLSGVLLSPNIGKDKWRVEFPNEDKVMWIYRKQGQVVSRKAYSYLLALKGLPDRAASVQRVVWAEVPDEVDVTEAKFKDWVDSFLRKDANGKYPNIQVVSGSYVVNEPLLRKMFDELKKLPKDLLKYAMKYPLSFEVNNKGGITQRFSGSSKIVIDGSQLTGLSDDNFCKTVATLILHEQIHAIQRWDRYTLPDTMDKEFQTYIVQLIALRSLGFDINLDQYSIGLKGRLHAATYVRD